MRGYKEILVGSVLLITVIGGILLAVIVMTAATFAAPRDCRHVCRMDANGVAVSQQNN